MKSNLLQKKINLLLFILLIICGNIFGQAQRETRAVWLTTNFRLDWPPAKFDPQVQKAALIEIFDDIKNKNFNTVFFQVRFNSTVLYKSDYEPMSFYITGRLGDTTAYDPLEFAIELAHKRGLEIHAWVNVLKCFDGAEKNLLENPKHVFQKHSDWIVKDVRDGAASYWFDPGLPKVKEYIVNLVTELALKYDVDGIHYDYLRYPGKDFDDEFSYSVNNNGLPKEDWRRNNLTDIVKEISDKIKTVKPYLKIGAAPIGIYKNQPDAKGLEGYNDVFQDAREWLKLGYLDYVVPQIYWDLENNPRFDIVASDWVLNSYGRNVILGIGAYKPEVYNEIDQMIQVSRKISAGGVAFFRYGNIKDYDFNMFDHKAFPADMAWLDGIKPNSPLNLTSDFVPGRVGFVNLRWNLPTKANAKDSLMYLALYSVPSENAPVTKDDLFEVISAEKTSVTLGILRPKKVNYYFTLKSVTKLWNESEKNSNILKVTFPELKQLVNIDEIQKTPMLIKNMEDTPKILICLEAPETIVITANELSGLVTLLDKELNPGKNIISLKDDISKFSSITIKYSTSGKEIKLAL